METKIKVIAIKEQKEGTTGNRSWVRTTFLDDKGDEYTTFYKDIRALIGQTVYGKAEKDKFDKWLFTVPDPLKVEEFVSGSVEATEQPTPKITAPDWDAKDRVSMAQTAFNASATLVGALVTAGSIRSSDYAERAMRIAARHIYQDLQKAKKGELNSQEDLEMFKEEIVDIDKAVEDLT